MNFDVSVQKHAVKMPAELRAELEYYHHQREVTTSAARRQAYGLAVKIRERALVLAIARCADVIERQRRVS